MEGVHLITFSIEKSVVITVFPLSIIKKVVVSYYLRNKDIGVNFIQNYIFCFLTTILFFLELAVDKHSETEYSSVKIHILETV